MSIIASRRLQAAAHPRPRPLVIAAATVLVLFAFALAGTLVLATASTLSLAPLLPVAGLTVAAFIAERLSRRATDILARSAALPLYILAVLLLPAPWAVVIATVAVAVSYATVPHLPVTLRVVACAHTVVLVTLITILAHAFLGDMAFISALYGVVQHPSWPLQGASDLSDLAAAGAAGGLRAACALAGVALGCYLLDTLPLVVIGAVTARTDFATAWDDHYGRIWPADLAFLALAVVTAVAFVAAPPAAYLAAPATFVLGALPGARPSRRRQLAGAQAPPTLREHVTRRETRPQAPPSALDVVLDAILAIGRYTDPDALAGALARAAGHLTGFQDCTVFLYESRDGTFIPYACSSGGETPDMHDTIPRDVAERVMQEDNRFGRSYYARVEREPGYGADRWRHGDVLLVPLQLKNGDIIGFISLDRPADGCVPARLALEPLETLAILGAGVVARLREADAVLHLAETDGLTGLLNRRALEARLQAALEKSSRRHPLALMIVDLDDFGTINNTHGHLVGDEALRIVSGVIHAHLRQTDTGGRYGGDEFVVILPGLDADSGGEVAERVRVALAEATTRAAASGSVPQIHTSIGVAVAPRDGDTVETLIKAADDALYESKRLGKNRVVVAS